MVVYDELKQEAKEMVNQEVNVVKAVFVNWSENYDFNDNTAYSFEEFERIAWGVASSVEDTGCYDKTSVTVRFTDGEEYNARVDLNPQCTGLRNHVTRMRNSKQLHGESTEIKAYNSILAAIDATL